MPALWAGQREMSRMLCVGEALIDLVAETKTTDVGESELFHRAAGGAVANVAVGIARLGGASSFAGTISRDSFGRFLLRTLVDEGVDVQNVRTVDDHTTLAFVSRSNAGERGFEFVREPGADSRLTADDVPASSLASTGTLHFGGVLLSSEPARSACITIASRARAAGTFVSFDPNARPALFASRSALVQSLREGCAAAHLVKLSEEDLDAIGLQPSDAPQFQTDITRAVILSRGARGCTWWCEGRGGTVLAPKVKVVDTTGAGDAMMAAILWCLDTNHSTQLSADAVADAARAGCVAGAIACTKVGAIPSLPTQAELREMLSRVP